MPNPNEDYYGWTQETIEKLRQGRLSEVNTEDLIEEIDDMGASKRRELQSRLDVLLMHLLKWQYQPDKRTRSWLLTIKEQRLRSALVLKKNPSLKPQLLEILTETYPSTAIAAARETGLEENTFPPTFEETGWSWEQVLDLEFYPERSTSNL